LKQTGPLRQVKLRGLEKVDWLFVFSCAAHNLIPDSQTHRSTANNAEGTVCLSRGSGHRDDIPGAHKPL
jgi:hypothetical protein